MSLAVDLMEYKLLSMVERLRFRKTWETLVPVQTGL